MKLLIWVLTGFLALLWTGAAAMLAAAVNWLAASSADPAIRGAQAMAQWPLPDWLAVWLPPGVIEPLKTSISELLGSVVAAASWVAPRRCCCAGSSSATVVGPEVVLPYR